MPEGYAPGARADSVADWVELQALARKGSVGHDRLVERGREVGYGPTDVSLGLLTATRRRDLLGDAYPFVATGQGLGPRAGAETHPWVSLLLMSQGSPAREEPSTSQVAVLLETLTAKAVGRLFGEGTRSVRFGFPSDEGRPQDFGDALRWLASLMGSGGGGGYRSPFAKDGGVDVVAWRPFPDRRSGFPVWLVQCTLERDWRKKAKDVETRVWASWLGLDVDPSTALAVPDVVPAGIVWNELAARTTVLDRVRLAGLLGPTAAGAMPAVSAWTADGVADLRVAHA